MTRGLEKALGLPPLSEALGEVYDLPEAHDVGDISIDEVSNTYNILGGNDHSESMDRIYTETLGHARDIADLGHNVDHARAARMFEVSATFYKVAMDAKNSKIDAKLKAVRVAQDQKKLDIVERQATGTMPTTATIDSPSDGVMINRNDLLAKLKKKDN